MIVVKFGGTSVADAPRIRDALEIVRSRSDRSPVVVVSAQGGVTDRLIELARQAVSSTADPTGLTDRYAGLLYHAFGLTEEQLCFAECA